MKKKCLTCGHDPNDHFFEGKDSNLYKQRKLDRKMVKDFCVEQKQAYSNHITKPIWRKCCGILDRYSISFKDPRAGLPSYIK